MPALTADQLELLQRARDGLPMWGGIAATDRPRRDVDLLLALLLIEPTSACSYQPTKFGSQVLRLNSAPDE